MRIWFDTEFIEDGKTIDLLSIGMIREDGRRYYAEPIECDRSKANQWVKDNVINLLNGPQLPKPVIRQEIFAFAGENPEFWAWFGAYDWIALCQLYGTMMDLPANWPMFCMDLKQLQVSMNVGMLPEQRTTKHHALNDAIWTKDAWTYLQKFKTSVK